MNSSGAKTLADVIHLLEQLDIADRIVKQGELIAPLNQTTKLDADQPDELSALVELVEQFQQILDQYTVVGGISDLLLAGIGIEISVPDLDGHLAGQLSFLAQF